MSSLIVAKTCGCNVGERDSSNRRIKIAYFTRVLLLTIHPMVNLKTTSLLFFLLIIVLLLTIPLLDLVTEIQ
jgi:hypothetical protein